MIIALDYDGTYTADPGLWDYFIALAQARGHEVICVTQRFPHETVTMPCEIVYTSRQPKGAVMAGRMPQIWIDDMPSLIFPGC